MRSITVKTVQNKNTRIPWLDILKGIGIVLVVIGHIYINEKVVDWIYSFHMPLFFFSAGWIYKRKPILTDIKDRLKSIVVPYIVFGIATLMYWQLIERHFRSIDLEFHSAVFGLMNGEYDYLGFNTPLWFLPCFFVTVVSIIPW